MRSIFQLEASSEYEKFSNERRTQRSKRDIAGDALRRADPAQVAIPVGLIDEMAATWIRLHKYFSALAHGSADGTDKFADNLEEVERMVVIILADVHPLRARAPRS